MSEDAIHSRRRLPGVGSLPGANFLGERLSDTVLLLSALPEIVATLRTIQAHMENVDREVSLMRQGVDRLHTEVTHLGEAIQELGNGINEVSASVGRLEPHVSDISRLARPLKHIRGRANAVERQPTGDAPATGDEEPPVAGFA